MTKLWEALDILREGGMVKDRRVGHGGKGHCAIGLLDVAHRHIRCIDDGPLIISTSVTSTSASFIVRGDGRLAPAYFTTNGFCETCPECQEDLAMLDTVIKEQFPERWDVTIATSDSPVARVVRFNNHPLTTQEELELVFHKAAIKTDEVLSS